MRRSRVMLLPIVLVVAARGVLAQDEKPAPVFPEALASELQVELERILSAGSFPGMTAGVVLPGGATRGFAVGVSDLKTKRAMRSEDRMLQGSVGKTYVAAVALQLVDEGKLELGQKVARYLGEEAWYRRVPNAAAITVRHLMTHTSGVMRYEFKPEFIEDLKRAPDRTWKPEELVAYVLDEDPGFAPGEDWEYSDTNYILLGMILERVTGAKLFDEIQRRLLLPLGLKDTVPAIGREIPGLVPGYLSPRSPFSSGTTSIIDGRFIFNPQFEWAGGGWASTSLDLARWGVALYEGRAFSKELLRAATDGVPAKLGPESRYGLGVIIQPTPQGQTFGHSGFFPGYLTELRYYAQHRFTLAIQINTSDPRRIGRSPGAILDALAGPIVEHLAR